MGGDSLLATEVLTIVADAIGRKVSLDAIFQATSLRDACQRIVESSLEPDTTTDRSDGVARLSSFQQYLWQTVGSPKRVLASTLVNIKLQGSVNTDALKATLETVTQRHSILRSQFIESEGQVLQRPVSQRDILIVEDLKALSASAAAESAKRLVQLESLSTFDLPGGDRPFRAGLIHISDDQAVLLLNLHWIAGDTYSLMIILSEALSSYLGISHGTGFDQTESPPQFADFANQERDLEQSFLVHEHIEYWREILREVPTRSIKRRGVRLGVNFYFSTSRETLAQLLRVSREHNTTIFTILLAAFSNMMSVYLGTSEFVIMTSLNNRKWSSQANMVGPFQMEIPLRFSLSQFRSWDDLVKTIHAALAEAREHSEIPFSEMRKLLGVGSSASPVGGWFEFVRIPSLTMGHDFSVAPFHFPRYSACYNPFMVTLLQIDNQGLFGWLTLDPSSGSDGNEIVTALAKELERVARR